MGKINEKLATVEYLFKYRQKFKPVEPPGQGQSVGELSSYDDAVKALNELVEIVQRIPQYDVVGMKALVEKLRYELKNIHMRDDGLDSINKLSKKINVSRTYLSKFRDGGMVCMNIMNSLAEAFGIRYMIENYDDQKIGPE